MKSKDKVANYNFQKENSTINQLDSRNILLLSLTINWIGKKFFYTYFSLKKDIVFFLQNEGRFSDTSWKPDKREWKWEKKWHNFLFETSTRVLICRHLTFNTAKKNLVAEATILIGNMCALSAIFRIYSTYICIWKRKFRRGTRLSFTGSFVTVRTKEFRVLFPSPNVIYLK